MKQRKTVNQDNPYQFLINQYQPLAWFLVVLQGEVYACMIFPCKNITIKGMVFAVLSVHSTILFTKFNLFIHRVYLQS